MPTMVEITPNREALVQRKALFFPSRSPPPSISRTLSESTVDETIEKAQSIITKWDPNPSSDTNVVTYLFRHNRDEAEEFLQNITNLRHVMHYLVSRTSANHKLARAQKLMQISMKRLEKEFYHILSTKSLQGPFSADFDEENETETETMKKPNHVSETAMADLGLIADCMIRCGYRRECVKIYTVLRKSVVDEGLYRLGIERYRSSHLHKMKPQPLRRLIKNWLTAIKPAVRTIFSREKILCGHVFASSEETTDPCFLEIVKEGATNLFRFPELIAKRKQSESEQRVFMLMELHETVSDLWPEIDLIFKSTSAVRSQALTSIHEIGVSVQTILSDYETTIQRDSSKTLVSNGGVHPLTYSVMNYVSALAEYEVVLSEIIPNHPPSGPLQLPLESPWAETGPTTTLPAYLARLILILLCKIDSKTGAYRDASLSYLFLANNLQFIVNRVHTTRLRNILGDEWVLGHAKKVVQYASSYQTMAWTKVFSALPAEKSPALTPEEAKQCFIDFNVAFGEAYRKQTSWVVPDGKLRDEVKVCIARNLVPVYRDFYETYLDLLGGEEGLVRFVPDDLENYLSDLFHGSSSSGSASPDSSTTSHLPGCLPR